MGKTPRGEWLALGFAIIFPTLLTFAYFVWLAGQPSGVQQAVYAIGKALQFSFPLLWVILLRREQVRIPWPRRAGISEGAAFGTAVLAAMLLLYFFALRSSGLFDIPAAAIREKIADLGIDSPAKYLATGLFYALFHSLMEEYYWRWFVFGRLRKFLSFGLCLAISSLGFMAHHVVLLATYFGWDSPNTYLLSISVAVGGLVWAWIYERHGTLYGPWLSHLLVDAGIFWIGYDLANSILHAQPVILGG